MSGLSRRWRPVVNPKPFVIPELKEWKGAEGAFVPTETTKIVCPANQPELLRIARMLADDCETMFGHKPEVVQGKGGAGDVILANPRQIRSWAKKAIR